MASFKQLTWVNSSYAVLAIVSNSYPPLSGRLPTRYSPVRDSLVTLEQVRCYQCVPLACIRHAASVRPEPGSNSHVKFELSLFSASLTDLLLFWQVNSLTRTSWLLSLFSSQRSSSPLKDSFFILANTHSLVNRFLLKIFIAWKFPNCQVKCTSCYPIPSWRGARLFGLAQTGFSPFDSWVVFLVFGW